MTSLLAGDVFRDIGARSRFWLFKFWYYMSSLKHARTSLRLWWLRITNPRIVFSGGTTPVNTAWTPGLHPDRLEMSSSDRPEGRSNGSRPADPTP